MSEQEKEIIAKSLKDGWKRQLNLWTYEGKQKISEVVQRKNLLPKLVEKDAFVLRRYLVKPYRCLGCRERDCPYDFVRATHSNVISSCRSMQYGAFNDSPFTMLHMDSKMWILEEERTLDSFDELISFLKNLLVTNQDFIVLADKHEISKHLKIQL